MADLHSPHGILFPGALPEFHRREPAAGLEHLVRWYWIARWSLPEGAVSVQRVLPFPAANLVVAPSGVTLSGATTRVSSRDLTGTGWVLGVLLRPAGLVALGVGAERIVDAEVPFEPERGTRLAADVRTAMGAGDLAGAADTMSRWWQELPSGRAERLPAGAGQADRMLTLVEDDPDLVGLDDLARRMGLSVRAMQRLAKRFVGLPPSGIIRRRRLQEAAVRLREDPDLSISRVAAELGYADQAHLAADFRSTLGLSAREYRAQRQP